MADRYFIGTGGSVNWTNTATWSSTIDGLTTPVSAPVAGDNVYPSAICPAGSILNVDTATQSCDLMDWTGAANPPTIAGANRLIIYGSIIFIAGMTVTLTADIRASGTGSHVITTAGVDLSSLNYFDNDSSGTYTHQDDFNLGTRELIQEEGTRNTNGRVITCGTFTLQGAAVKILTLGASIINCTAWNYSGSNLTLNANTSSIRVSGTGAFAGGGLTYNEVQLNGTAHTISGSNTFRALVIAPSAAKGITLTAGTVQTVGDYIYPENLIPREQSMRGMNAAGWNLMRTIRKLNRRDTYAISSGVVKNYGRTNWP